MNTTKQSRTGFRPTRRLGALETVRLVRDCVQLELDEDSPAEQTIGAMIDHHLRDLLIGGDEVQSLTLHLDTDSPDARRNLLALYGVC